MNSCLAQAWRQAIAKTHLLGPGKTGVCLHLLPMKGNPSAGTRKVWEISSQEVHLPVTVTDSPYQEPLRGVMFHCFPSLQEQCWLLLICIFKGDHQLLYYNCTKSLLLLESCLNTCHSPGGAWTLSWKLELCSPQSQIQSQFTAQFYAESC